MTSSEFGIERRIDCGIEYFTGGAGQRRHARWLGLRRLTALALEFPSIGSILWVAQTSGEIRYLRKWSGRPLPGFLFSFIVGRVSAWVLLVEIQR